MEDRQFSMKIELWSLSTARMCRRYEDWWGQMGFLGHSGERTSGEKQNTEWHCGQLSFGSEIRTKIHNRCFRNCIIPGVKIGCPNPATDPHGHSSLHRYYTKWYEILYIVRIILQESNKGMLSQVTWSWILCWLEGVQTVTKMATYATIFGLCAC